MADGWQPLGGNLDRTLDQPDQAHQPDQALDLPAAFDVLAKRWSATTNEFEVRRFTDVTPHPVDGGAPGYAAKFIGVEAGWYVTHFMTIPEPPKD